MKIRPLSKVETSFDFTAALGIKYPAFNLRLILASLRYQMILFGRAKSFVFVQIRTA